MPDQIRDAIEALRAAQKALRAARHAFGCPATERYLNGPCNCWMAPHAAAIRSSPDGAGKAACSPRADGQAPGYRAAGLAARRYGDKYGNRVVGSQ